KNVKFLDSNNVKEENKSHNDDDLPQTNNQKELMTDNIKHNNNEYNPNDFQDQLSQNVSQLQSQSQSQSPSTQIIIDENSTENHELSSKTTESLAPTTLTTLVKIENVDNQATKTDPS